jgi:radical SAM protein with 4Fe4S-binding SPASM domain
MITKNIRTKKRINLNEVIPLETPLSITIDPCNICNFSCEFCPTGDKKLIESVSRESAIMEFELFTKIIDDISNFPNRLKKMFFHKDGEPLLNKNLPKMIMYAKDKNISDEYWLTTNGSLLNETMSLELIDSGLDLIRISVEAVSNEGYKKISKVDFNYDKLIKNIEFLFKNRKECRIYVKILDYGLTVEEKNKFLNDFRNISTEVSIDLLSGWSFSEVKDFTLDTKPKVNSDKENFIIKEVCPYPFYNLVINSNGTVCNCCCDWSHSTIIGDVRKQSLVEIWNGQQMFEFRKMHLNKQRNINKACKSCYAIKTLPDNIDDYADEILDRLSRQQENI